ncbi:MAG: LysM peptidoglycan-binding domain-containing M23 family metallopeptidase [Brevefilum sp.]|nr:LysM peptidoglycan-binding domain-containing M23 family metallopeptidase [Brevefilum sp.]
MNKQQEPLENNEEIAPTPEDTIMESPEGAKSRFLQHPILPKLAMYAVTLIVMVLVVWGVGSLIVHATMAPPEPTAVPTATPVALPEGVATPVFTTGGQTVGLMRAAELNITQVAPVEVRYEVTKYTVEAGDTIFGIAEKFGLKPETVLWSNRYVIGDIPDGLSIGVELFILPMDGLYHRWSEGEGLNGVASFYGVSPDVIVDYPGNNLDREVVGDFANPNIPPGTMLVVPGGERPTVAWIVPRDNPASGNSYLGPGACGGIIYGNVGTGTFTYPTSERWLSGYEYNPPVHNGLDFAGRSGFPIYASDSGVIVYSGWSDRGYGNLIVVDHDRGWQSFYAHLLDGTMLPCGSNVQKGQLIGSMGSTGRSSGPHLHFELRLNGYPVNPWQFLN